MGFVFICVWWLYGLVQFGSGLRQSLTCKLYNASVTAVPSPHRSPSLKNKQLHAHGLPWTALLLLDSILAKPYSFSFWYASLELIAVSQWPMLTTDDFRPYLKHAEVAMVQLIIAIWDSLGYLRHLPGPGRHTMRLRRDCTLSQGQAQAGWILCVIQSTAGC